MKKIDEDYRLVNILLPKDCLTSTYVVTNLNLTLECLMTALMTT